MGRARWPAFGPNNPSSEASFRGGFDRGLGAAPFFQAHLAKREQLTPCGAPHDATGESN